jgi:hypothetical protein
MRSVRLWSCTDRCPEVQLGGAGTGDESGGAPCALRRRPVHRPPRPCPDGSRPVSRHPVETCESVQSSQSPPLDSSEDLPSGGRGGLSRAAARANIMLLDGILRSEYRAPSTGVWQDTDRRTRPGTPWASIPAGPTPPAPDHMEIVRVIDIGAVEAGGRSRRCSAEGLTRQVPGAKGTEPTEGQV